MRLRRVSIRIGVLAGLGTLLIGALVAGWLYNRIADSSLQADVKNINQVAFGRLLYDAACASCHGKDLEGQPNWQSPLPTGVLPAPPHDESGHTWHHPDQILFRITKFGGAAEAPPGFKSGMPALGPTLSDEELWAILAYIKNRWPEPIQRRQAEINRRYRER